MTANGHNKFGFVLRAHERRLRELERRLGIASPTDPLLESTGRRDVAETKETRHVRSNSDDAS
jgi:hypothetical protein